jgi:hypothetical protein
MPTLRSVLTNVSGLYRDVDSGARYLPHELLSVLSPDVLESIIRTRKVDEGRYLIEPKSVADQQFELISRRRQPRPDSLVLSERVAQALVEWEESC